MKLLIGILVLMSFSVSAADPLKYSEADFIKKVAQEVKAQVDKLKINQ